MFSAQRIRERILFFELMFICRAAFLKRVPLLRRLHRNVTADLAVLEPEVEGTVAFTVDFRSPYFHLPVTIDKTQVGRDEPDRRLQAASFRFFDWQTWAHIDGAIEWRGERRARVQGQAVELITGFGYSVAGLSESTGNLGLRLAEGVEGTVRIACGAKIARVPFDPVFWLLEATHPGFRPVPIKSNRLMGLIVSLFDIGSGDPRVRESAIERLQNWAELNLDQRKPAAALLGLLSHVRDWGPLGLEPLFPGVNRVIERLQVRDPERHLFEFFADNWGVRGNLNGRRLAVKLLESLATERARGALQAIFDLVRNQDIVREELDLIRSALESATVKTAPAETQSAAG